ncbi:MAG: hypothetical protein GJ680_01425 [Alteromonadaceae bacterium]|nr:hypothetical protein [Alteromonadaceae bacterium]
MKLSMLSICAVLISLLMSGCSAIDALQFLYNNKMASHTWQTKTKQTSIPFEVLNQQVIAEVTVNGTKNPRMVLDTGAQATVFFETDKTKSFINSLDGKLSIGGVGDKSGDAYFLKNTDLSIGSVAISGLTTIFIKEEDNPMFASQEVTYVDGVIGSDLFTRFVTDINFTKRTITLAETMEKLPSEYQRTSLEIKGSLPYLDIEIENEHGSAKLPVLFDSGGIGSLHISSNTSVTKGEMLYQSFSSGVGGKSNITVNHLGTVIVGDFQIPAIIGGVSENGTSKTNIMGTGLINRFNMILDYASEKVFLSANENFATPD